MLSRLSPLRGACFQRFSTTLKERYATTPASWIAAKDEGDTKTLRKSELVRIVATAHDLTLEDTRKILDTFLNAITKGLVEEKGVPLTNFGSFTTYQSKPRMGRNPNTGEPMEIKSKRRVKFKPYTNLKTAVAGETN